MCKSFKMDITVCWIRMLRIDFLQIIPDDLPIILKFCLFLVGKRIVTIIYNREICIPGSRHNIIRIILVENN